MNIVAVIPIKPPARGKSRLGTALDAAARAALSRRMFEHVVNTVRAAALPVLVVSRDEAVRDWAGTHGCATLAEQDTGELNDALAAAYASAPVRAADGMLVVPADLPCLAVADIAALCAAATLRPSVVIAPDRAEQGTNALLLAPATIIPFAFGPESFGRHCAAARAAGIEPAVLRRPNLALDIDTAADLARWRGLPAG